MKKFLTILVVSIIAVLGVVLGMPALRTAMSDDMTPMATPDVTPEATPEVTSDVAPEATPDVTSESTTDVGSVTPVATSTPTNTVEKVSHGSATTFKATGFSSSQEEVEAVKAKVIEVVNGDQQTALDLTLNEDGIAYLPVQDGDVEVVSDFLSTSGDLTKVARVGETLVLEHKDKTLSLDYEVTGKVSTANDSRMAKMVCDDHKALKGGFISYFAKPKASNYFGTLKKSAGYTADIGKALCIVKTSESGEYAVRLRTCDCKAPAIVKKTTSSSSKKSSSSSSKKPSSTKKPSSGGGNGGSSKKNKPSHPSTTKTPAKKSPSHPATTTKPSTKKPSPPKVDTKTW